MQIFFLCTILVAAFQPVTASATPPNAARAFERASEVSAPAGYTAYLVRLWGAETRGRFTDASVDESGRLRLRSEAGDDGHVGAVTVDREVLSVIFLPRTFTPTAELLALRVARPADFHLSNEGPAPFTLRLLGIDPTDPAYRLYETHFPGTVVSGTLNEFELNEATVARGYPYRGPIVYRGSTKRRPARYAGEKSVVRIPVSVEIPPILLYRP